MTTHTIVSAVASTVLSRITAAAATLGGIQQVLDRDEDPSIIAKNAKYLPTICVFPFGASKFTINFTMGGSTDFIDEGQILCVGYYRFSKDNKTPYSDIDTIRQYALGVVELFRPTGASPTRNAFNMGVIYKATVEIAPYQEFDYVLDRFVITLFLKFGDP